MIFLMTDGPSSVLTEIQLIIVASSMPSMSSVTSKASQATIAMFISFSSFISASSSSAIRSASQDRR